MRLLKHESGGEISLTRDLSDEIPPYAILSHTWGLDEEEVTFQNLQQGSGKEKSGFTKIRLCGEQARRDGLQHFWVDTCCIDKSSHSELSEAINSMYHWYEMAAACYVYLADVAFRSKNDGDEPGEYQNVRSWKPAFRKSRWFTRGWTLQELIAPDKVIFYSKEWERLGTKGTLEELTSEITTIPIDALRCRPLSNFSVAERMRWTKGRVTKKKEDRAYCLFGIFKVFLPLIYGEGDNAYARLIEEINKQSRAAATPKNVHYATSDICGQSPQGSSSQGCDNSRQSRNEFSPAFSSEVVLSERRKELLNSLHFDQMDSRRSTIKNAYASTCTWILKHSKYLNWTNPQQLEHHLGFLWINGKPGAGKSTLMKFMYTHADEIKSESELAISFFFNARGDLLERSTLGMYCALLFDLLQLAPDLQDVLDKFPSFAGQIQQPMWTVDLLHTILSAAVMRLGQRKLKIFIDALDECDEDQVREMVSLFEELALDAFKGGSQLYICYASRHYPTIDIRNGQKLILEDEDGHGEELAKYVQSHLRAGKSTSVEEIRKEIHQKANGVFMWAVLVIPILNEEFRRGRIFAVKNRLKEIPAKLSDLFREILKRDAVNMDDLLLCLQWILFAKRPLRREEFYFAMVTILDPGMNSLTEWDPEQVSVEDMNNFVLSSSKGLAELTKSVEPTVQFIHESVRDFLIKDKGLCELWPDLAPDLRSLSHDILKRGCQNYLSVNISKYSQSFESLPDPSSMIANELRQSVRDKFPFLEYATMYVLYHADEAASGVSQEGFLRDFDLHHWLFVNMIFAIYESCRHTMNASLLYVLVENDCSRLLNTGCHQEPIVEAEGERYRLSLVAALANGDRDALRAILQREGDSKVEEVVSRLMFGSTNPPRKDQKLLDWVLSRDDEALVEILLTTIYTTSGAAVLDFEIKDRDGKTALIRAAEGGNEKAVALLCENQAEMEAKDKFGWTALHYAVLGDHEPVLRILLRNPANIEARANLKLTALHLAAILGNVAMVRLLLEGGADVESRDYSERTAFARAVASRKETVVEFLLNQGVDIETRDNAGNTPLFFAAEAQSELIVQLLLAKGANIEARNKAGLTPLSYAVANADQQTALSHGTGGGYVTIVKLILDNKADIEAKDQYGYTALWHAISRNNYPIARLLIARGADINTKDLHGKTLLSFAHERRHQHGVAALLNCGVDCVACNDVWRLLGVRHNRLST